LMRMICSSQAAIVMRRLQLPKVLFMLDLTALSMWRKTHDTNDIALLKSVSLVTGAAVLNLAANDVAKPGTDWESVGYPEFHRDVPFGIGGTISTIHAGISKTTLQLFIRQGTNVKWDGISGSPVLIGGHVASIITQVTDRADTVWAAPIVALRSLLHFSRSSNLIGELSPLLSTTYSAVEDITHLTEPIQLRIPSPIALEDFAKLIGERAWRGGPDVFSKLLSVLAADNPDSPAIGTLQTKLADYLKPTEEISQGQLVREVMQLLAYGREPDVALLEPLRFGAQQIVEQIVARLKESSRPELPVRLVPAPNTHDKARLYEKLYRDLRRGLEREFGQPLPPAWKDCLAIDTGEMGGFTFDAFEKILEKLLDGPIIREGRILILVIEGFSRVAEEHLPEWANMMSRLAGASNSPLKLLVWGGQDLHALCTGYTHIQRSSPFQRLKRQDVGPLSSDEMTKLMTDQLGQTTGADTLYNLTDGHPALVYELLEQPSAELRNNDKEGLRARILNGSSHLRLLKNRVKTDEATLAVLHRLLRGDGKRRGHEEEYRLRWLGVIKEQDAGNWQWAAPILEDWARQCWV
jgi:hypothetical protein